MAAATVQGPALFSEEPAGCAQGTGHFSAIWVALTALQMGTSCLEQEGGNCPQAPQEDGSLCPSCYVCPEGFSF